MFNCRSGIAKTLSALPANIIIVPLHLGSRKSITLDTEKRVEICSRVFLMNFEVLGNLVKHFLEFHGNRENVH